MVRYDFDGSGTLNSSDELSCLAANMISVLRLKVDIASLDRALQVPGQEADAGKEWTKPMFREWFIKSFCVGQPQE